MRPNIATIEAVPLMVRAASMRLAGSGNRPAPAEALVPAIVANARIHSDSSQRSLRRPSRTSAPVPASVSPMVGLLSARSARTRGLSSRGGTVVAQEQLLEGRGLAGEGDEAGRGQRLHQRGKAGGLDLRADPPAGHHDVMDPHQVLEPCLLYT